MARRLGWPLAIGGGTSSGAEAAAQCLVSDGAGALVSFGLAGGLDPTLPPGSVIVPFAVIDGARRYSSDPQVSNLLGGTTPHLLLGASAIAATSAEKARLYSETGAAAIDLESAAVARVAATHGIPFAVLRAICDPASRALPSAALTALDGRGAIAIGRVLASIAAHPTQIPTLLALASDATTARRALFARVGAVASVFIKKGPHGGHQESMEIH
jgi:adenosylhomocysteine nucleosidase